MAQTLLTIAVVATVVAVVAAIFVVLWRERTSAQTARAAVISGVVLAAWAAVTSRLASSGFFLQTDAQRAPPIGIALVIALVGLTVPLIVSPSLRSPLTNQRNLVPLAFVLHVISLWQLFRGTWASARVAASTEIFIERSRA
jgi:hypothetical protein